MPILKKVVQGEKLADALSATSWNAFVDTANIVQQAGNRPAPGRKPPPLPAGQVYLRNNSGGNRERFGVLGVSNALIDPAYNANGFAETPAAVGVTPTADHVGGRFVVLVEPIATGKIGRAFAGGICVCKVNVTDAAHHFADAVSGNNTALVSGATGPVHLLWKQSGTGDGKWAIGRFGISPKPKMVPVTVTTDGGVGGTNATTCTLTYTVKSTAGETLATAKVPKRPRYANCEYDTPTADSPGLAYYDAAGDLQLYEAVLEKPKGDVVAVQEQRLNGLNIEVRTRNLLVLEAGDYGAWTVLDEGTTCP